MYFQQCEIHPLDTVSLFSSALFDKQKTRLLLASQKSQRNVSDILWEGPFSVDRRKETDCGWMASAYHFYSLGLKISIFNGFEMFYCQA